MYSSYAQQTNWLSRWFSVQINVDSKLRPTWQVNGRTERLQMKVEVYASPITMPSSMASQFSIAMIVVASSLTMPMLQETQFIHSSQFRLTAHIPSTPRF